ncbi:efflux transporter outer membrane subunit [Frateuria defendens]|uniref:efflux transporter outer membrane subunit n=1 Tax=Frateuria defendens TaxID=2219559 RepID=UPI00066FB928|nr:efflux transporter outer membrane subunit [Frateuria defendens]
MKPLLLPAALAACLLAGCTMEPAYQRPNLPVPDRYPAHGTATEAPVQAADLGWRDFFRDPALQSLVAIALENNRDLRVAAAKMAEARANYGATRASLFPEIGLQGYAGRQRLPAMAQQPANGLLGPIQNDRNKASTFNTYQVQAGMTSYELDFFGRQRAAAHASGKLAEASAADYQAARIALIGEVANAYLALNADRALLQLAQQTLATQQQHAGVMQKAFADGGVSEFDMRRSQTQVNAAQVDVEDIQLRLAKDINAMAVLIGQPLPAGYASPSAWQAPLLTEVPAGLPSSLLDRRPDIVAAEDRLRAANADIGRARAAFFPNIALTAVLGTLSGNLSSLFSAGSAAWNGAASASVPLLDFGRRKNGLAASKARHSGAEAAYEGAVQQAFREVADALATRDHIVPEIKAQQALVDESQHVYAISQVRFKDGLDDYIATQDAQRSLYAAQQKMVSLELDQAVNQVNLYKALGGGWSEGRARAVGAVPGAPAAPLAAAR